MRQLEDFTKEELQAALVQAVNSLRFERVAIARMCWFSHGLNISTDREDEFTEWYRAKVASDPEWLAWLCSADHDPKLSRWEQGDAETPVNRPLRRGISTS